MMGGDRKRQGAAWAAAALLATSVITGCASNPPCTTPITEVQSAQGMAQTKARELASVQSEKHKLEAEVRQKEQRLAQLNGKPEELNQRIEVLEKGSGRR
jgi:TolA-binding protein